MASNTNVPANTSWARWQWSKGLGRWHALFVDGDLTKTACSSPRKNGHHVAAVAAARPADGPLCPTCKALDDIVEKSKAGQMTDAVATTKIAAPAVEKIAVPAGACLCGAASCDKGGVREIRMALKAQDAAEASAAALAAEAGFEAWLIANGKATVKA